MERQRSSEQLNELFAALAKAQGEMNAAAFNKVNPHFKNKYADFASCRESCREPLAKNGLCFTQHIEEVNGKYVLITRLGHASGQWMISEYPLFVSKLDSQGIGSATSYAKRYSLCSLLGIVSGDEDDDGEAASKSSNGNQQKPVAPQKITDDQKVALERIEKTLDADIKARLFAWLKDSHSINSIDDVAPEKYETVLKAFRKAVKTMEDKISNSGEHDAQD